MVNHEPNLMVKVDVTNPGQFFACCGLLELAHRLSHGKLAEGWFSDGMFCIATGDTCNMLGILFERLSETQIEEIDVEEDKSLLPVHLADFDLTLDWWVNRGKKTPLKLWAGNQTSVKIVKDMKGALVGLDENMFNCAQLLTGRFGFDPRSAWNALDKGFSPNEHGMKVDTYPVVELLAAIGLQRFRPKVKSGKNRNSIFSYSLWSVPLSVVVAFTAAAGLVPAGLGQSYSFRILDRGSYGGFDYANKQEEKI